jgi:predicted ribosome quality control (RQC) complex YloA/Tae2 family protein
LHNNYFFFRILSQTLEQRLKGYILVSCFSQNKDELILGFASPTPPHEEFYIKALLESSFSCLDFPQDFRRTKRNSVDLFSVLQDRQVKEILLTPNDRSFSIVFEGEEYFRLLFKMHGNRSNIILLRDRSVVDIFKHQLAKDAKLDIGQLPLQIEHSFKHFAAKKGNPNKLYPTLGPVPAAYLESKGYEQQSLERKWQMLNDMLQQLHQPEAIYTTWLKDELRLSLLPLGDIDASFQNPIDALNHFFLKYIRDMHLVQEKGQLIKRINKQIVQSENYIQKNEEKLEELQEGTSYSQVADIIMANMHQIPPNSKKVVFNNFYTNNPIEIKLKQELSPQKNAEILYRKSKNQKIEIEKLKQNIDSKEAQLLGLYDHLENLQKMEDIRAIRQYAKEQDLQKNLQEQETVLPYKTFTVEGFQVWVGKNAASNDNMLRNHSWKEDLWLHAKDVPGSHVLIKHQAGKNFPNSVIERAASLAAFYSRRKTDSLCPVIVTPRKFVRKSKNMLPGQVIVDKEDVVLVEPHGPKNG